MGLFNKVRIHKVKKNNQPKIPHLYHPVVCVRYWIKLFSINNSKEMLEVRIMLCSY